MLNFRQLRNTFFFIVVTASLCVAFVNQVSSKASPNKKVENVNSKSQSSSPTPPTKLGTPSDENPLINKNCGWEATKTNSSEQLRAFRFHKKGQMKIHYNSSSGGFFRNAKYELSNNSDKYPQPINIILGNRTIETIFELKDSVVDKKKVQLLRIELIDIKPGQPRPSQITEKGVREFRPGCSFL
ncbi:MAG: hypothetical protein ACR9NN_12105 [Nostochopsis sp.]